MIMSFDHALIQELFSGMGVHGIQMGAGSCLQGPYMPTDPGQQMELHERYEVVPVLPDPLLIDLSIPCNRNNGKPVLRSTPWFVRTRSIELLLSMT